MSVGNKYVKRTNIFYGLIIAIVLGIGIYMRYDRSKDAEYRGEPEIVEEIIESIPSVSQ